MQVYKDLLHVIVYIHAKFIAMTPARISLYALINFDIYYNTVNIITQYTHILQYSM